MTNTPSIVAHVTNTDIKPVFNHYVNNIITTTDPTTVNEAVKHHQWCQAMNTKLDALESNGTWEITTLPPW